jgi:hypothetical protein
MHHHVSTTIAAAKIAQAITNAPMIFQLRDISSSARLQQFAGYR